MKLPKKYKPAEAEKRWQDHWAEQGTYKFDRFPDRPIYSIDTPPPTVSGKIHIGHVFSYVQAEVVARYQRMLGHNVYYPFGFDDNGLPSERLVEKEKGVKATDVGREKFIEMCLELTKQYEVDFIAFWKSLGLSVDWEEDYSTIDKRSQRISQRSFIDLYEKGRVYRKEAPTLWCPECHTAIAQAEIEDAEHDSVFYDVAFEHDGKDLVISTTRPELLPACVGMFAHPSDERYAGIIGKKARVPLFDLEVPIMTDEKADPEKGTGLVMCCTFGDTTDIEWWQEHGLGTRIVFDENGKMNELAPGYEGLSLTDARKKMVEDLGTQGKLKGERPISHVVNTHERCGTAIEFSVAAQWFIRVLDIKDDILEAGAKVQWCPQFMAVRFQNWVENLAWDWCVSRQRYYGVPFPLWTCKACGEVVLADRSKLPVDPTVSDPPIGSCPECGGELEPERDIMDTWMTSSCTPFLNIGWGEDDSRLERFKKPGVDGGPEYLMDLRPQAHDIIRTWAFYTIVKGLLNEGKVPWRTAMISGHTLHPDRAKISKSKGDAGKAPSAIVEERSADVVRYWASSTRLGTDTILAEEPLDAGHRLVVKLWNASKFAIMRLEDCDAGADRKLEIIDRWLLAELKQAVERATRSFDVCDYHGALEAGERFFWHDLCDNYIEIAKKRLYGDEGYSEAERRGAQHALYQALLASLKMFAPIMPHITEEIHSLFFQEREGVESIHVSAWPEPSEDWDDPEALEAGRLALAVIEGMRKVKSVSKVSVAAPVGTLTVACDDETWSKVEPLSREFASVSNARRVEHVTEGGEGFVDTDTAGIMVAAELLEDSAEG
jgi:valyl-tRNA synthetase